MGSFVQPPSGTSTIARDVFIVADSPHDDLVAVLDEVIYRMDTDGQVPLGVRVRRVGGRDGHGLVLRLAMADILAVAQIGAVPKAHHTA